MRKTVVSGAQSPQFACVRQKRFFKKGLLQNVLHFATAPLLYFSVRTDACDIRFLIIDCCRLKIAD
jgi:hypothetical protein